MPWEQHCKMCSIERHRVDDDIILKIPTLSHFVWYRDATCGDVHTLFLFSSLCGATLPFICHKRQTLQQKHSAAVKFHISHGICCVLHCSNCLEGTFSC